MSEKDKEYFDKITDEVLTNMKNIGRGDMSDYIVNTYKKRYEKIKDEGPEHGIVLDLDKLRGELGQIRGIGGQRLDEIMAVIKRNIDEAGGNEG